MKAEPPLTTFALSDLALQSAVELDRARLGGAFDTRRLTELADALSVTVAPDTQGAPFRFVEPGYYEPFERLLPLGRPDANEGVEAIQAFFSERVHDLRHPPTGSSDVDSIQRLKAFCIALHRELIRELSSEHPFVRHDRRRADLPTASGFRAT